MNSRILVRFALVITLGTALAASTFAQYGGGVPAGGMGGATSGVYMPSKGGYSSGTGIAIGAGAAAGVGLAYFMLRNRGSAEGCVVEAGGGIRLVNEKDNKSYSLNAGDLNLRVGERVKLHGKKIKSSSGEPAFEASKLVKDYGACNQRAALSKPSATP